MLNLSLSDSPFDLDTSVTGLTSGFSEASSSNFPLTAAPDAIGSSSFDEKHLTFIDTGIDNYQQLADSVIAGDVIFLDARRDGVSQITDAIAGYDNITGLHIVSHGEAGQLSLGSATLNGQTLQRYQQDFKVWEQALSRDADILLYGCDVAAGVQGSSFVHELSESIGADVAASTDLTGNIALLGDWDLEFTTGSIESTVIFNSVAIALYEGTLATFNEVDEVRIMPLGDSITRMGGEYDSYRRPLWQKLVGNGYTKLDFVGSQGQIGPNAKTDFDTDNEAYGGWRADQILANIGSWAASAQPDIVLLHLGSNDMIQGQSVSSTLDDIGNIIDKLRNINPNVAVLLAQITPSISRRGGNQIRALGDAIPGLAQSKNKSGSPVILVDQRSGFNVSTDTYDGLHPNQSGEVKMANRWYSALTSLFQSGHQYNRNENGNGAQPSGPIGNGDGLFARYYNNIDFTNEAVSGVDATVDFNWGSGSPDRSIGSDTWSARWTGQVQAQYSETYTFYTSSDDGVRLWVNGQLLIDGFKDQAPTEYSGSINLVAGQKYDIRMDYYENRYGALAQLGWSSASQRRQVIPQSQLYSSSSTNGGGNTGGNTGGDGGSSGSSGQPATPAGSGDGLFGQYYNNIDFTNPAVSGVDATVDFNWGSGSPDRSIGVDTWSARWTGQVQARYSEAYTFHTTSDDGVRLWVNGQLIIDGFRDQAPTEYTGTINLVAGQKYDIRMDYYENGYGAVAQLAWSSASQAKQIIPQSQLYSGRAGGALNAGSGTQPPTSPSGNTGGSGQPPAPAGSGDGLFGQYYNNIDFTNPAVSGVDATVDFNWGSGSPDRSIGVDTWSARWTGQVQARYSEAYTFHTTSDDGVRLWVNGQLIIDGFRDQAPTEYTGTINLVAGQKYDIRMDYYENGYGAMAQLAWSSASQAKQIVPQSQLYSGRTGAVVTASNSGSSPTPASNGGSKGSGNGLFAQYYNNINFTNPAVSGVDATVDFNWGSGSPDRSIGVDTWSARWTGKVQAQFTEAYTFHTTTDDGVRLWVNGQLIIDGFRDQAPTEYTGTINLVAGQKYDIRMDYYENGYGAVAQLAWSSASQAKQVIPQSQLYAA